MYAVIESGGKQYRVQLGAQIQVDRLDVGAGESITFDRVLLVADGDTAAVGQPHVAGAVVSAEVVSQDRGDKIVVFKYRPKARRRVKKGFRAALTTLRISDIAYDGQSAAQLAAREAAQRERAEKAAQKAAAEKAAADQALAARLAAEAAPAESGEEEAAPGASAPTPRRRRSGGVAGRARTTREAGPHASTEPSGAADVAAADEAPTPEGHPVADVAEDESEPPSPATRKDT